MGPIARQPWGETLFYAKDPFGNPICFAQRGTEFRGGVRGKFVVAAAPPSARCAVCHLPRFAVEERRSG